MNGVATDKFRVTQRWHQSASAQDRQPGPKRLSPEDGEGVRPCDRIGFVDPHSGRYVTLAELPGFTRGLDFCGPLAFIGLSQVRESAVFSGIAIAERRFRNGPAVSGC